MEDMMRAWAKDLRVHEFGRRKLVTGNVPFGEFSPGLAIISLPPSLQATDDPDRQPPTNTEMAEARCPVTILKFGSEQSVDAFIKTLQDFKTKAWPKD